MEGEIMDQLPLSCRRPSLERPEPVVNPFLGQALAPLRCKDIYSINITTSPEILIQWPSHFVNEIDIAPLTAFIPHVKPPDLWTYMGMCHLQPGNVTDPAPCPIAQCEECSSAPVSIFLNQRS